MALCSFVFVGSAIADDTTDKAALFRLQGSVQRLTQENAQLQEQLAARDAEVAALKAKSGTAQTAAPTAAASAALQGQIAEANERYRSNLAVANAGVERARAQVEEVAEKYRKLVSVLKTSDAARAQAVKAGNTHLSRALACEKQNERLHDLALELAQKYEHKGFWQVVGAAEPFTQLQRVKLENEVETYRQQIVDLYAEQGPPPTAVAQEPAATASPSGAPDAANNFDPASVPEPAPSSTGH